MEFLGIGPLEFVLILVVAIVILGPKDMVKAGRTIGKFLRTLMTSDAWKAIRRTTKEFENIPTRLVREAGLEEEVKMLKEDAKRVESMSKVIASEATMTIAPPGAPGNLAVSTQTSNEAAIADPSESTQPTTDTIGIPVIPDPPTSKSSSEPGK
jgi:sec-independent protein translocase protein TatB